MSYQVLARTWRPQSFGEVVGQNHVTQTLKNAISQGRVAHAYLFSGPRGVGKTSLARIFAKALNCDQGPTVEPCGRCPQCREITEGRSQDVQEIDGASNRGIEEIRELRENVRYLPSSSRYKIYIIDEVHMLTKEAFNALLKTLEEPPAHVLFFFATTEMHRVPATILSRCQKFLFRRVSPSEIEQHLQRIVDTEKVGVEPEGLAILARQADGSVRDALSLLDQVVSYGDRQVTADMVRDVLGLVDRLFVLELIENLVRKKIPDVLDSLDRVYSGGYDLQQFYQSVLLEIRSLMLWKVGAHAEHHKEDTGEELEARRLLDLVSPEWLQSAQHHLLRMDADMRYASFPRLVLEMGLLRLAHLGDFYGLEQLPPVEPARSGEHPPEKVSESVPQEQAQDGSVREPAASYGNGAGASTPEPTGAAPDKPAFREEPAPTPPGGAFDTDAFLDAVAAHKPPLSYLLRQARTVRVSSDGELVVEMTNSSFNISMLREHANVVEELASQQLGAPLKMRVVEAAGPLNSDEKQQETLDEHRRQMRKKALEHPIVKEIRGVLRGEVAGFLPASFPENEERDDG